MICKMKFNQTGTRMYPWYEIKLLDNGDYDVSLTRNEPHWEEYNYTRTNEIIGQQDVYWVRQVKQTRIKTLFDEITPTLIAENGTHLSGTLPRFVLDGDYGLRWCVLLSDGTILETSAHNKTSINIDFVKDKLTSFFQELEHEIFSMPEGVE